MLRVEGEDDGLGVEDEHAAGIGHVLDVLAQADEAVGRPVLLGALTLALPLDLAERLVLGLDHDPVGDGGPDAQVDGGVALLALGDPASDIAAGLGVIASHRSEPLDDADHLLLVVEAALGPGFDELGHGHLLGHLEVHLGHGPLQRVEPLGQRPEGRQRARQVEEAGNLLLLVGDLGDDVLVDLGLGVLEALEHGDPERRVLTRGHLLDLGLELVEDPGEALDQGAVLGREPGHLPLDGVTEVLGDLLDGRLGLVDAGVDLLGARRRGAEGHDLRSEIEQRVEKRLGVLACLDRSREFGDDRDVADDVLDDADLVGLDADRHGCPFSGARGSARRARSHRARAHTEKPNNRRAFPTGVTDPAGEPT